MRKQSDLGGTFSLPDISLTVKRMGYGAMQLAGKDGSKLVWGPPRDVPGAIAVLREAIASGVNHIDTSDFYGPHITNQLIKQALHPYPNDLVIVTKVGARRGSRWLMAACTLGAGRLSPRCTTICETSALMRLMWSNLRLGGLTGPTDEPFEEPLTALAELKQQGLIRHIGLSTVSPRQLTEAQADYGDRLCPELLQPGPAH